MLAIIMICEFPKLQRGHGGKTHFKVQRFLVNFAKLHDSPFMATEVDVSCWIPSVTPDSSAAAAATLAFFLGCAAVVIALRLGGMIWLVLVFIFDFFEKIKTCSAI